MPTIDYLEFKPITLGWCFSSGKIEWNRFDNTLKCGSQSSAISVILESFVARTERKKQEQFQHMIKINIPVFIKSATVACCSRRLHLHASGLGLLGEVEKKNNNSSNRNILISICVKCKY